VKPQSCSICDEFNQLIKRDLRAGKRVGAEAWRDAAWLHVSLDHQVPKQRLSDVDVAEGVQ
jgi:hypothetical protein